MKHDTTFHHPIEVALKAMHEMLTQAAADTLLAQSHMECHEQNAAIGTLIVVKDALEQSAALYQAVIAMHRFTQ